MKANIRAEFTNEAAAFIKEKFGGMEGISRIDILDSGWVMIRRDILEDTITLPPHAIIGIYTIPIKR